MTLSPLFVALEGLDGAGTTTQVNAVGAALRQAGVPVVCTREPSDGPIGAMARARLRQGDPIPAAALALLFAADRLEHHRTEIAPALASGHVVLSDRYVLSSLAYQSIECDAAWVRAINALAPPPDLTVYLRIAPERAFDRLAERATRDRFEHLDLLRKIHQHYEQLAPQTTNLLELDATASMASLTHAIVAAMETAMEARRLT